MLSCVLFLIFFFKQKTAYDMRISDWSSDVCSSDLFHRGVEIGLHRLRAQRRQRRMVVAVGADGDALFLHLADLVPGEIAAQMLVDRPGGNEQGERQEIGRASCRERVCQYV